MTLHSFQYLSPLPDLLCQTFPGGFQQFGRKLLFFVDIADVHQDQMLG